MSSGDYPLAHDLFVTAARGTAEGTPEVPMATMAQLVFARGKVMAQLTQQVQDLEARLRSLEANAEP
jgi:malonyl CoA-acyl carrier protein transacylase